MSVVLNRRAAVNSQDGAGLEVFLVHSLGLTDLQDLCVAQVLQAAFELVQGVRLGGKSSHDLFPHHLHHLRKEGGEMHCTTCKHDWWGQLGWKSNTNHGGLWHRGCGE